MANAQKTTEPPSLGVKFLCAGMAACSADVVTFPLDTAKVRLQLQSTSTPKPSMIKKGVITTRAVSATRVARQQLKYRGMVGTIRTMCREEGARSLYNGIAPGLQRQMVFASIRIGLYEDVKQFYVRLFQADGLVSSTNVGLRIIAGITTGAIAISCAQPTDVVKVRLQAQGRGGPQRYKGAVDAYKQISKQEGVRGLWKGLLPNAARNAIVNAAELVTYDMLKEAILKRKLLSDNMACHFVSAFGAGFLATVVASPVDVVKTRFMNASKGLYRGAMQCAMLMYKEDGLKGFYKGFIPGFMRLGSWNIVMFMCFEQFKKMFMQQHEVSTPPPQRKLLKPTPSHHRPPAGYAPASQSAGEVLLRQPALAWANVGQRTDSELP